MKTKRRLLSLLMAGAMLFSTLPVNALAAGKNPDSGESCKHHPVHTAECGYTPAIEDEEGRPCTYECHVCPLEERIAALPDEATEDNREDMEEQAQIDISHCLAVQRALDVAAPSVPTAERTIREDGLDLRDLTSMTENQEEGWKWEPDVRVLTLTSCHIKGKVWFPPAESGKEESKIVLVGDSTIESIDSSYQAMISENSGQMQLTITGSGSLTFTAPSGGNPFMGPYAIAGSSLLIEEGVTIRANVCLCIINRDFILRGGSVILKGENVFNGIYTNAGDIIIEDGIVDIDAGQAGFFLPGLPPTTRTNNVKISGGTVKINAPISAIHINHQEDGQAGERIQITGGEVQLSANSRAFHGKEITVGEDAKLSVSVNDQPGLVVSDGYTVKLAAGTYSGSEAAIRVTAPGMDLADLLEEGYVFFDKDDHPIILTEGQTELVDTVTVKKCTHTGDSIWEYEPIENTYTHKKTCLACGYIEPAETCIYDDEEEYKFDENGHWQTCTFCEGASTVTAHVFKYHFKEDGTYEKVCQDCAYAVAIGTCTMTQNQTLLYGNTAGIQLKITTDPEIAFTDAAWYEVQPNAGKVGDGTSYTLPALSVGTYIYKFTSQESEDAAITITVDPAPLTTDMVTLATENVIYSGIAQEPAVTVKQGENVLVENTDYTIAYSNNIETGTGIVTITGKGNYTSTVTKTFVIAMSTPNVTAPTAGAIEYGQTLADSTLAGGGAINPNGGEVVAGTWIWANETTQPMTTGTFSVTFMPADPTNYKTPESVDVSVTVNPAKPKITITAPAYQIAGENVRVECTVENPYAPSLQADLPAVTLTYTIDGETKAVGTDGIIPIPSGTAVNTIITITASTEEVAGKYIAMTKTATVTVTKKIPVTISGVTEQNGTYDGGMHIGYSGTPSAAPYTGSFISSYTGRNGTSYNSETAPINAGDYTVTISVPGESEYIGSITLDFTIDKSSITIKADNKKATVGTTKPALTYTVIGLADGDALAAAPILICDANMDTIGKYPITASGAAVPSGSNYNTEITYVTGILEVIDRTIPITTVTLNKARLTLTVGSSERLIATIVPSNATDKSVIWTSSNPAVATVDANGKITAIRAGTAVIIVTTRDGEKTASCTVTVKASGGGAWNPGSDDSSDDSSSDDSSDFDNGFEESSVTINHPDEKKPDIPTTGRTEPVKPNEDGKVKISDDSIQSTINKAVSDADKNGHKENGIVVTVPVDNTIDAESLAITISGGTLDKLIAAKVQQLDITTNALPCVSFTMDTLKMLDSQSNDGDLILRLTKTAVTSTQAKEAIGIRPAYALSFMWVKDDKEIPLTDWKGQTVSVKLPYTPAKDEQTGNICVVYVDANGKVEWLTQSSYDADQKALIFEANRCHVYGVGYKNPVPVFTDITGHWAANNIIFVASRGLLDGTGNDQFSPDASMTRGVFVTALGRLTGIDPESYKNGKFTDVRADAYYASYVNWSTEKGIMNSMSATTFSPDTGITREQMAVIMANYVKKMGYDLPVAHEAVTFVDNAQISSWAAKEVRAMQQAGIMAGKDNNCFDPKGIATRAEVATILRRFIEIVIDPQAAQGWVQNHNGSWQYMKEGKIVLGWLYNDEKWYWLDKNGWMFAGGWKEIDDKWYYFHADGAMAANTIIDGIEIGPDGTEK